MFLAALRPCRGRRRVGGVFSNGRFVFGVCLSVAENRVVDEVEIVVEETDAHVRARAR